MQCKTHMAVGIAAGTAIIHTGDLKIFLTTIAGATIGSIISDLDSYNSELSQILNKITAIIVATVLVCIGVTFIFKIDICDRICDSFLNKIFKVIRKTEISFAKVFYFFGKKPKN